MLGRSAASLAQVASWRGAYLDHPGEFDVAALITATLADALIDPAAVGACRLSSEMPDGPLFAAAARILPQPLVEDARRSAPQDALARGIDPLLGLASLLAGGPALAPILVASLSRHGEARVVVLTPPPPPIAQESSHA